MIIIPYYHQPVFFDVLISKDDDMSPTENVLNIRTSEHHHLVNTILFYCDVGSPNVTKQLRLSRRTSVLWKRLDLFDFLRIWPVDLASKGHPVFYSASRKLPGFQGAVPKGFGKTNPKTTHQTQRLKPNSDCCWELAKAYTFCWSCVVLFAIPGSIVYV